MTRELIMGKNKKDASVTHSEGKRFYNPLQKGYQPVHDDLDDSKPPKGGSGVLKAREAARKGVKRV
jgi:hypothetical protein